MGAGGGGSVAVDEQADVGGLALHAGDLVGAALALVQVEVVVAVVIAVARGDGGRVGPGGGLRSVIVCYGKCVRTDDELCKVKSSVQ